MRDIWQSFVKFFTSLKLTVVLLALGIVLIFIATLAQGDLGVWGVQKRYFHTFFVLRDVGSVPVPVFPGGYFIGGLLLINLVSAHIYRFQLTAKKIGIQLAHAGVILLLVGELLAGLWQEDFQMNLKEGETRSYAESFRHHELVIVDTTDPQTDQVVAIPEKLLARRGEVDTGGRLPFRVIVKGYWPNTELRGPNEPAGALTGASFSSQGLGARLSFTPVAPTTKDNEGNLPVAAIELAGPGGSIGSWLVSPPLDRFAGQPQSFEHAGRQWRVELRVARDYQPFSLTLLKVTHDIYPGTTTPKNFSSRVRVRSEDGRDDRETLIYMNNPLRHRGLTFYQFQMDAPNRNSVLQVVRNPSWTLPYVSCALVSLGLLVQFGFSLLAFVGRRKSTAKAQA